MPILSQNDFLLPFLQLLADGESLTRSQMLFRLAKHFNIAEDEAQADYQTKRIILEFHHTACPSGTHVMIQ